jgi:hypothetical protein
MTTTCCLLIEKSIGKSQTKSPTKTTIENIFREITMIYFLDLDIPNHKMVLR